ncbi:hypothetical protein C8Q80DRAFT_746055 [Daedaleopsis nitida]|nr:hypothetical protein C8Q80DRAFT_746055 [Daedaleopsis nitida]
MASAPAAGFAKSLSESRAEALQALLESLAPGAEASRGDKLPPDHVRRISDRLGELLGEDAMPDMSQRNEKGELVNEEGLPIIDIVEPVSATEPPSAPVAFASGSHDPDLIPLWALSLAERARRSAERDRILDALEEEERVEQEQEQEQERDRFKADLEKRKQAAEAEMNALKKAREMQKKMGKALLRNLAAAREQEQQEKLALEEADKQAREERRKLKPKKSVTFADLPPDHEYQPANSVPMPPSFDWGDVAPATIQRGEKPSLITKTQMDQGPMRMNVVERVPGRIFSGPKSPPPPTQEDSDDESEPGSVVPADSDDGEIIISDHSDSEDLPASHDESDESDYGVPEDNEPIEWDDESYNFARHQREVALEYYEKRATVGAEALAAMRNHEHTAEESEWDQPNVPLEATLASSPPKPAVSRFKTSRTSSSSLPSKSLGGSILPASQSSAIKGAVRLGKIENENLVGGDDGESDDELDPAAKDLLERIKRGEVMNVGPSVSSGSTHGPAEATAPAIDGAPTIVTPSTTSTTPLPSRVSKFKMSLTESSSLQVPSSPGSSVTTPINATERSSPKLPSREVTPISVPTKNSTMAGPSAAGRERRPMQRPGIIVDSPSFPAPGVIASPSFSASADATTSPAFHSMVIESPSFYSPSSTLVGTPGTTAAPSPNVSSPVGTRAPLSASVLERRPVVASEVHESGPATSRSASSTPVEKKKVSRFLAERG